MDDLDQGLTTQPEPSLRDEIAGNLAAAISEPASEPTETAEQKETRERDEKGRFAPKSEAAPPLSPEPAATAAPPLPTDAPIVKAPPRPSSWKKEHWQDWEQLAATNPKLAGYLNEREGQFASGVSTYKQEWESAKPLIDAIAPHMSLLQQHGIQPGQFISNLANSHQRLSMGSPQDKMAMFQKLIQDYNIPAQLAIQSADGQWQLAGQAPTQQRQQPAFDPSMVEKLVEKKLTETSTKQALAAFQQEAPTKYPHFETVRATMSGLLQAGLADDLPSAYEAALRHPRHADLFAEMQQQQSAQQEAERKAAAAQKVQRARANAVSTTSTTPSGVMGASGEKGLRDEITANLRSVAGGRV